MDLSQPPLVDTKEVEDLAAYNNVLQGRINLYKSYLEELRKKDLLETRLKRLEIEVKSIREPKQKRLVMLEGMQAGKWSNAKWHALPGHQPEVQALPLKHEDETQSPPAYDVAQEMRLQWEEADIKMEGTPDWKQKYKTQWTTQKPE
jgi:hypothetical protein